MFEMILTAHVPAGILGLLLGPVAMLARKRRGLHTWVGRIYFWNMALLCVSAAVLAVMHWRTSWFFFLVSGVSFWFAVKGFLAVRRRPTNWRSAHIRGMLGSYIALVTAALVVTQDSIPYLDRVPGPIVFLLPTLVAVPLIRRGLPRWANPASP